MGLLVVPGADAEPWPTIGGEVCDFIEERAVYGPGSLQGQPYVIDPEFRAFIYRLFEVYPKGQKVLDGQVICFSTGTRLRTVKRVEKCPPLPGETA